MALIFCGISVTPMRLKDIHTIALHLEQNIHSSMHVTAKKRPKKWVGNIYQIAFDWNE